MAEAVLALPGGLEGEQRVQEVGYGVAGVGPAAEVGYDRVQVGRVVREERRQLARGVDNGGEQRVGLVAGGGTAGVEVDRAVLRLEGAEFLDRGLQPDPGRVASDLSGCFVCHDGGLREIFHSKPALAGGTVVKTPYIQKVVLFKGASIWGRFWDGSSR